MVKELIEKYQEEWAGNISSAIEKALVLAQQNNWFELEKSLNSIYYKLNDEAILSRSEFSGIEKGQVEQVKEIFYNAKKSNSIPGAHIKSLEQVLLGIEKSLDDIIRINE